MNAYECLMPYCRAQVYTAQACCEDCWADRRGQLASLPDLYAMTYALLTPGSRQVDIGSIHVPALDPAAPMNLIAYDTLTYGYDRLAVWAALAHQLAGNGRLCLSRYYSGRGFQEAARVLGVCDHRFALAPYAGAYVLDVFTAYRRLAVQCLPTEPRHLNAPCPDCHAATLITRHADEYVMCLTCANTWPHSQMPMLSRQAQRTAS